MLQGLKPLLFGLKFFDCSPSQMEADSTGVPELKTPVNKT